MDFWKKTYPYFIFQALKFAKDKKHWAQIFSFRKQWSASFKHGRNSVTDELPWLNVLALEYLKEHLRPDFRVFEYGGGGSTLYFCQHVSKVHTVEDNAEWFHILESNIQGNGIKNWTGYFVSPELFTGTTSRCPENPSDFMSGSKGLANLTFEKYVRVIDQFPEAYFDVVLVDGRARPSCIQQSLPRLKKGGLLIIDNTEREYYLTAIKDLIGTKLQIEMDKMAPTLYTPDFTKTTIIKKYY